MGYSPWSGKELDTIELLSTHTHTFHLIKLVPPGAFALAVPSPRMFLLQRVS